MHFLANYFYPLILLGLLVFCGLTAYFKAFFASRKIQAAYPSAKMVWRDTGLSFLAPMFFLPSAALCAYFSHHHWGFVYHDIGQYGKFYFVFSLVLVTLVHDTYYYWFHRLLHTRWLYQKIHSVHHTTKNPCVMTFFAMHPLELALMALSIPLCAFLFPICDAAFNVAYGLYMVQTIYGHSGFDSIHSKKISTWFTTSHLHNLHHQVVRCNYSYFYNGWDRLCGTLVIENKPLVPTVEV